MKRLGLVLGSGGARGIAHVGFLQALDENGIRPHYVAGCSMGSVVGGLYCNGMTPAEMLSVIETLKSSDVIDLDLAGFYNKSVLKTAKMTKLVDGLFGDVTFEELSIPFVCNAFDIISGKTVWLNKGKVAPCVRASSSIPGVFRPVEMNGKLLVDGGVVRRMPIDKMKSMGAQVVVGVDVLGKPRKTYNDKNLIGHVLRVIDAVDWAQTEEKYKKDNYDLLLFPDLKDMSQYVVKDLLFAYDKGYELGIANVENIKHLIEN